MADVFSLNCRGSINIYHDVLLRKYAGNAWGIAVIHPGCWTQCLNCSRRNTCHLCRR